jgi:hypothetical protein
MVFTLQISVLLLTTYEQDLNHWQVKPKVFYLRMMAMDMNSLKAIIY